MFRNIFNLLVIHTVDWFQHLECSGLVEYNYIRRRIVCWRNDYDRSNKRNLHIVTCKPYKYNTRARLPIIVHAQKAMGNVNTKAKITLHDNNYRSELVSASNLLTIWLCIIQ